VSELKKRNQEALSNLSLTTDTVQREKSHYDREKKSLLAKIEDANAMADIASMQKANADKAIEKVDARLKLALSRADELIREIVDSESQKAALITKISSLVRQKEEADEIAAQNQSKFRKTQSEVKEANDRADEAEHFAYSLKNARRAAYN